MRVGSLFSGIGGFDLGFERAGMRTEWFVEQDEFCKRVLNKHWANVPVFDDVCHVGAHNLSPVDLICGGFPCQDLSVAGNGAGLDGERSGLWAEFARIIGELRPRYVVIENVAVLKRRGLNRVLADLASLGFDAEWDCIPASAVGAPHQRDRLWLVAYSQREQLRQQPGWGGGQDGEGSSFPSVDGEARLVADAKVFPPGDADVEAHPVSGGGEARVVSVGGGERGGGVGWSSAWAFEPDVGRVADGVPDRVDRLRALGNALVPQIAEWIGRRIIELDAPV